MEIDELEIERMKNLTLEMHARISILEVVIMELIAYPQQAIFPLIAAQTWLENLEEIVEADDERSPRADSVISTAKALVERIEKAFHASLAK